MLGVLILQRRIQKEFKKLTKNCWKLVYDEMEFPVKNNICINVFGYENGLVFPIYVSDEKFKDYMDMLLLI